jgi:hypothetical protein
VEGSHDAGDNRDRRKRLGLVEFAVRLNFCSSSLNSLTTFVMATVPYTAGMDGLRAASAAQASIDAGITGGYRNPVALLNERRLLCLSVSSF